MELLPQLITYSNGGAADVIRPADLGDVDTDPGGAWQDQQVAIIPFFGFCGAQCTFGKCKQVGG